MTNLVDVLTYLLLAILGGELIHLINDGMSFSWVLFYPFFLSSMSEKFYYLQEWKFCIIKWTVAMILAKFFGNKEFSLLVVLTEFLLMIFYNYKEKNYINNTNYVILTISFISSFFLFQSILVYFPSLQIPEYSFLVKIILMSIDQIMQFFYFFFTMHFLLLKNISDKDSEKKKNFLLDSIEPRHLKILVCSSLFFFINFITYQFMLVDVLSIIMVYSTSLPFFLKGLQYLNGKYLISNGMVNGMGIMSILKHSLLQFYNKHNHSILASACYSIFFQLFIVSMGIYSYLKEDYMKNLY